ncbi:hypothetical protein Dda_5999 [Drechslerella dactyloides]|uniref:Uncharacterized protein n=1 Tax=Drechslerella dactyloides TaxID=74499 RepID=A0AAD6NI64_DREDA|nr:hypothetical protein Dda_5999 [Drechslerella dactyloides]
MMFNSVALTATFAAAVLGAALPVADPTVAKRDHIESLDVWQAVNATEEYSRETDDAWIKVDMKFPMTIFDKSDSTIYFSMNGLISLSKPGSERSLPSKECTLGSSCLPESTVALNWEDLYIKPKTGSGTVTWTYHDATLRPEIREHYHMSWALCSKAASGGDGGDNGCGAGARYFNLNYFKNQPGIFHISYSNNAVKEFHNWGVIGAQSLGSGEKMQTELPVEAAQESHYNFDGVDYSSYSSCVIIDTIKKTTTWPKDTKDC